MESNEYWRKRALKLENRANEKSEALQKKLKREYTKAAKEIRQKVDSFYLRYANEQGLTYSEAIKALTAKEAREWHKTIGEYVEEIKALPDGVLKSRLIAELDARSYASQQDRLSELASQIDMEIDRLFIGTEQQMTATMTDILEDGYYRKSFDLQQRTGVLTQIPRLSPEFVENTLTYPWSGADFSTRLWNNKRALLFSMRQTLTQGAIQGQSIAKMSKSLAETMGKSYIVAERLIRTEANHFHSEADRGAYEAAGVEQYEFMATLDNRVSEVCAGLDGKIFDVKDAQTGVNYPPMHPNCVLPDTKIIAPDAEAIIKGEYLGNVVEFGTSDGTRLTVTANHIVLTARGWVRAKNLLKGDKVIRYCGRVEPMIKSNPANNDSIPTIEELFATLVKSSAMPPLSVPVSAKDLKGDAIPDSEVDVVFVNRKLRDKLDTPFRELVCDIPLVGAGKTNESLLPAKCSLAEFLVGAGLAADGIMSSLDVAKILLGSSLTHHQLVSLRKPSDYNARLQKTAVYNGSADTELLCEFVSADAGVIKGNNLSNVKFDSNAAQLDAVSFEQIVNRGFVDPVGIGDFVAAFPDVIAFDDIVFVTNKFYSGHIYDASSLSTLYIANGILSSNCRSTTVEHDPEAAADGEPMPDDMDFEGWEEWQDNVIEEDSPRKPTKGEYGVNWAAVHSEAYNAKIRKITSNDKAVTAIENRAKWALNNRDGKNTEELYAIDLNSGKEIARITNQSNEYGVARVPSFDNGVIEAAKKGAKVLLLHNHPRSLPPSISDINNLFGIPNALGITIGHDGSIYLYSAPKEKIPMRDYAIALRKNKEYTEITAIEKALNELSKVFGFRMELL